MTQRKLPRRALLASALALAGVRGGEAEAAANDAAFPDGAGILVAGPADGKLDAFARALMPVMAHGLPGGAVLRRESAGGVDGVTGCNQFEARVAPDGATILLLPGASMLAWLVGDPRARFDASRFIPVLAGTTAGLLVSRRPLANDGAGAALRVAAARPDSADLAALLALELLGVKSQPVFGLADAAADAALISGAADCAMLLGSDAAARAAKLAPHGLLPVLSLGAPTDDGTVLRDPAYPAVLTLPDHYAALRGGAPVGPLYDAWRAVAVSAQLSFMMVLQSPTPAAMEALWRQTAAQTAQSGAPPDVRLLSCPALNRYAAPLAADAATLFELRRWLTERLNWQPS